MKISLWLALIALFITTRAPGQCQDIGTVMADGSCGLTIASVLTGSIYYPVEPAGLEAGQLVTFSPQFIQDSACSGFPAIEFNCLLLVSPENLCIEPDLIDITHPCTAEYEPVCGCDGITYENACQAENWFGVSTWVPGVCPGDANSCLASFLYAYVEDNTVIFYNNSTGYTGHAWDFGAGVILQENDQSIVVDFPTDTATVCLSVWNDLGCSDEFCLFIHSNAEEEMCQQTDCVWPGDADGDSKANVYDLLNIGLGYGSVGPERPFLPFPDDPIAWAPNYSDNWNNWVGPVNYKHLDCNGDGLIDEADTDAIPHNYTPDFTFSSDPTPGAPPVYLSFEDETIIIDENTPDFFEITADLMVGDNFLPVFDLHGMALQIMYPFDLVAPNTVTADYDDNSFFGHVHDILTVREDLYPYNTGRFDLAFSHKNGEGTNGYGKVATLSFVVSHDIIDGRAAPDTPFSLTLRGVKFIDSQGNPLTFGFPADTATIIIINDTVAGTGSPESTTTDLQIFPNPVSDWIQLKVSPELLGRELELFNTMGKPVYRRILGQTNTAIDFSRLAPGIYWLRIATATGMISRRIVVN